MLVLTAGFLQLAVQLRYRFEQVSDQAVVRHLEDGGFFVLVDRNDDLGVFHAGQMLDGTGDAHSNVQVRRNDLTGLMPRK